MIDGFDAHCHLDLADFDADREDAWARAVAAGVTRAVIPAVRPADWPRTLAAARPGARWVALGIHPAYLSSIADAELRAGLGALARTLRANAGAAVAVGECGLDGGLDPAGAPMVRQRAVFAAQVEVAAVLDLPLVVHALRCHFDVLDVLRGQRLPSRPGVVHSFSGGAELARAYLALGFHLSFGGGITRPSARRPLEALRETPRDRLLFETDAPDQRPEGVTRDGARCEPADLGAVIARAAEALGAPEDELARDATRNARALFAV